MLWDSGLPLKNEGCWRCMLWGRGGCMMLTEWPAVPRGEVAGGVCVCHRLALCAAGEARAELEGWRHTVEEVGRVCRKSQGCSVRDGRVGSVLSRSVMPHTTGEGMAFVASRRPPRPTSITAAVTCSAWGRRGRGETGRRRGEGRGEEGWRERLKHLENVESQDGQEVEEVELLPRSGEGIVDVPEVCGEFVLVEDLSPYPESLPDIDQVRGSVKARLVPGLPQYPLREAARAALALGPRDMDAGQRGQVDVEQLAALDNLLLRVVRRLERVNGPCESFWHRVLGRHDNGSSAR